MYKLITAIILFASPFVIADSSFFPIWGEEAKARGHSMPKPYGFSMSYMDMSNPIIVDSIGLTGTSLLDAINIDAPNAEFTGSNITFRGDVWILPFWNVYGILGYTQGTSTAEINGISCDSNKVNIGEGKLLCAGVDKIKTPGAKFALDMDGGTYGIGTTFAGGINNWFALLDMNYTYTDISAIDGDIRTFVAAPRVGYRWQYDGGREMRLFTGVMYQKVDQQVSGKIKDLNLPPSLANELPDNANFEVSQHADGAWNYIVGMQYAFNKDWEIIMENGFGDRKSIFMALGRRF